LSYLTMLSYCLSSPLLSLSLSNIKLVWLVKLEFPLAPRFSPSN